MAWETHEPEAIAVFADWLRTHPEGVLLDIGSSLGIFSAVGLFANSRVDVVAFDSDLSSLAAVKRLCQHASPSRLRLVSGLLTDGPPGTATLSDAVQATDKALTDARVTGDVGTTRFVCLNDPAASGIPHYRLDDLVDAATFGDRPILIKCDVEGAEMRVLTGAEQFLRTARPSLLLSVHPPALAEYGHSAHDVEALLAGLGYDIRVVAVDHEEHWWCQPGDLETELA